MPWRRLGEALGLPWELQGRPRKPLGVPRECLGEALGSFFELRGRIRSKHVENTELAVLLKF